MTASRLVSDANLSSDAAAQETKAFLTGGATAVANIKDYYTAGFTSAMFIFAGLVAVCTIIILLLGRKAAARSRHHAAAQVGAPASA